MSFQYMPLFTGDYIRDTRHLTPAKNGIYLLLLIYCWDQKSPLPLDEQECAGIANCRSADEIDSLRYILNRYFVKMDDGYYNLRMDREIGRFEAISGKRKIAGLKGYQSLAAKRKAIAQHLPDTCPAIASTVVKATTKDNTKEEKIKDKDSRLTAPVDVSPQIWKDWGMIRKAKHQPITETGLQGIRREAAKASLSLEAALRISVERGWAGFKASWLEKEPTTVDAPWKGAINL